MSYSSILFEVVDQVAVIKLNRPEAANALTKELCDELLDAAIRCETDPGIRAAVLTGSGNLFCAGGDLKAFDDHMDDIKAYVTATATALHNAAIRFNTMNPPLVMAINGTAGGGGFSLSLCGDYAIASSSAKFVAAYTASGLSPDGTSTYFLAKHIGLLRAKELFFTNRVLSAEEALDWGLISKVVEPDQVLDEAMTLARKFAAGPTRAFGATKRLLNTAYTESIAMQLDHETRSIADTLYSRDGRHGLKAFLNKEKPEFTGE
ncbi:MAG: enoyl-CoA hydratase-related protein [Pseudomonadota bacterium]